MWKIRHSDWLVNCHSDWLANSIKALQFGALGSCSRSCGDGRWWGIACAALVRFQQCSTPWGSFEELRTVKLLWSLLLPQRCPDTTYGGSSRIPKFIGTRLEGRVWWVSPHFVSVCWLIVWPRFCLWIVALSVFVADCWILNWGAEFCREILNCKGLWKSPLP